MAILKHVLVGVGLVLAIIGHLGGGTAAQEAVFWLGVLVSAVGLVLEVRGEKK